MTHSHSLRLYQVEACKAALDSIPIPGWSLVEVPTGGGKTRIIKDEILTIYALEVTA